MRRGDFLNAAAGLVDGDRHQEYGPASENFARIAAGWSVITGVEIKPWMVGVMMTWLKICRLVYGFKADTVTDGCAYLSLGGELHDENDD
jgi:hypothetical protein